MDSSSAELDLRQIKAVVSSLKTPLQSVTLTGGEAFLRGDLADICRIFNADNKTANISIITNGYLTDVIYETVGRVLGSAKANLHIQVSLDGLRETHNRIRQNKESFDNAVKTIQQLRRLQKERNFDIRVITVISQQNLPELAALARFVRKELGIPLHIFEIARDRSLFGLLPSDAAVKAYGPKEKSTLLSADQLRMMRSSIKGLYSMKPFGSLRDVLRREYSANLLKLSIDSILGKKRTFPCSAGNSIGVLYANGDVALCETAIPVGNLRECNFDFNALWHGDEANVRRLQLKKCYCCNTCYSFFSSYYRWRGLVSVLNLIWGGRG